MTYQLFQGDCLEVMRGMADNSVDSIVTDPPYGLKFMGKSWDYEVPSVAIWREALRVLKPGGHLLSFGGSRTYHRMAVNIEDAGFEIRDQVMWVYGCLDTQTQVATIDGVKHYHETKVGDLVLCYNPENGEYCYQPILEIVEYDYRDTAYRLVGDFGEQVVSRNHRVIIERGGIEAFQLAETLEFEARVPVLESLPALQQTLRDTRQGSGCSEQDVQQGLCELVGRENQLGSETVGGSQGQNRKVCGVRAGVLETGRMVAQDRNPDVQQGVQRRTSGAGVGETRSQGAVELAPVVGSGPQGADDWRKQPRMEGRVDLPAAQGCVRGSVDQIRPMPAGIFTDGESGRVRDGASGVGGECDCTDLDTDGSCAPHKPRCDGQPIGESDAVCHKRTAQGVRAWGGHKTAVVRVVPFHYTGKVWCLRVPTGAFVAVRDGVAFPTGNSGFPKSLDVSKAIDKAAGVEREVVGQKDVGPDMRGGNFKTSEGRMVADITAPATPEAEQWQGWGTALKPAHEPLCMARKPLSAKTVAANVLQHGTGAMNIDACRVPLQGDADAAEFENNHRVTERLPADREGEALGLHDGGWKQLVGEAVIPTGRWPANLIHDGSDEVVGAFPDAGGQQGDLKKQDHSVPKGNAFGQYGPKLEHNARGDKGTAARFFYAAKASRKDRNADNNHPTVKPTELMRYLCRLVTPAGGLVLDPFMGSGSTGKAAMFEDFNFIGIEQDEKYLEIARARIGAVTGEDLV